MADGFLALEMGGSYVGLDNTWVEAAFSPIRFYIFKLNLPGF